jgi:hypothetical protein
VYVIPGLVAHTRVHRIAALIELKLQQSGDLTSNKF